MFLYIFFERNIRRNGVTSRGAVLYLERGRVQNEWNLGAGFSLANTCATALWKYTFVGNRRRTIERFSTCQCGVTIAVFKLRIASTPGVFGQSGMHETYRGCESKRQPLVQPSTTRSCRKGGSSWRNEARALLGEHNMREVQNYPQRSSGLLASRTPAHRQRPIVVL